ncbi:MAG: hypothetical protein ACOH5I_03265 [Oligoflexus sp.]
MKNLAVLLLAFGTSHVSIASEHLRCDPFGNFLMNCRVSNVALTNEQEAYDTEFTIHYNSTCDATWASSIVVSAGENQSLPFVYNAKSETVKVRGLGPLSLKDYDPNATAQPIHQKCQIEITKIETRPSEVALSLWSQTAHGEIKLVNESIRHLNNIDSTLLWGRLYIKGEISASALELTIQQLEKDSQPQSKIRAAMLKGILDNSSIDDLLADKEASLEVLEESREILTGINLKFIDAGKGSQKYIADALSEIADIL